MRLGDLRGGDARLEDLDAQGFIERGHFDAESAGQARTHALLERLEIAGRPVGGHDHLSPGVDQRVERVAEFRLDRLALQELRVVKNQEVDRSQALLEGDGGLGAAEPRRSHT